VGGGRARVLATIETSDECARFVSQITGVYRLPNKDRIGLAIATFATMALIVPLLLFDLLDSLTIAIAVIVVAVVIASILAIDIASTTVIVSAREIVKRSRVRPLRYAIDVSSIHEIRLLWKSNELSLDVGRRTIRVPQEQYSTVFHAARIDDPRRPMTTIEALAAAALAGAGIGFVGAMIAGPLYSEISRATGLVAAGVIVTIAAIVGRAVATPNALKPAVAASIAFAFALGVVLAVGAFSPR